MSRRIGTSVQEGGLTLINTKLLCLVDLNLCKGALKLCCAGSDACSVPSPDRVRCFVFVFHWFAHPHLVDVWLLSLQTHHIGYNIWTEIAASALISNRLTYTGTDTMGLLFCLLKPGLEAALMLSTDALTCYNTGLKAGGMTTRVHEYSCQISVARRLRLYVQDIFLYFRITLGHFSVLPYLDAPPGYSKSWYF